MINEGIVIAAISLLGIIIQTYKCKKKRNNTVDTTYEYIQQEFIWDGGGNIVYIAGDFTNWNKIPMTPGYNQFDTFVYIHPKLIVGKEYQFKFIIDNEWKTSVKYNTKLNNDTDRIINNFIVVERSSPSTIGQFTV